MAAKCIKEIFLWYKQRYLSSDNNGHINTTYTTFPLTSVAFNRSRARKISPIAFTGSNGLAISLTF